MNTTQRTPTSICRHRQTRSSGSTAVDAHVRRRPDSFLPPQDESPSDFHAGFGNVDRTGDYGGYSRRASYVNQAPMRLFRFN